MTIQTRSGATYDPTVNWHRLPDGMTLHETPGVAVAADDTVYLLTRNTAIIMVGLIALLPTYIMWAPNALWKTFDLFVGLIQAFIFALLTILYFSQATETQDAHH